MFSFSSHIIVGSTFVLDASEHCLEAEAFISPEAMMHFPPCFRFPPISDKFQYIHPVSRKLLFPPTFENFLPDFVKLTCFLHTLCAFRFPPSLHHTMHVLDAPALKVLHLRA